MNQLFIREMLSVPELQLCREHSNWECCPLHALQIPENFVLANNGAQSVCPLLHEAGRQRIDPIAQIKALQQLLLGPEQLMSGHPINKMQIRKSR